MTEFEVAYLKRLVNIGNALENISSSIDGLVEKDLSSGACEIRDGLGMIADEIKAYTP
jgi:hypothetical protein